MMHRHARKLVDQLSAVPEGQEVLVPTFCPHVGALCMLAKAAAQITSACPSEHCVGPVRAKVLIICLKTGCAGGAELLHKFDRAAHHC